MKSQFGGAGGKISYEDFPDKKTRGERSGGSVKRGGSAKTESIGTTDSGDMGGYSGTVKDSKFRSVADASGWSHGS